MCYLRPKFRIRLLTKIVRRRIVIILNYDHYQGVDYAKICGLNIDDYQPIQPAFNGGGYLFAAEGAELQSGLGDRIQQSEKPLRGKENHQADTAGSARPLRPHSTTRPPDMQALQRRVGFVFG